MPTVPALPATPLAYLRAGLGNQEALDWYTDAREGCEAFALATGIPVARVASVLALTSPRVSVQGNAALARSYLLTGSTAGLLPSVRASLAHYEATGRIRGPKVGAFYRAILGDCDAVVVDVWVQRALGHAGEMRGARYHRAANVVRALAGRAGVSPREAQAAIWYGARAAAGFTSGTTRLRIDRAA